MEKGRSEKDGQSSDWSSRGKYRPLFNRFQSPVIDFKIVNSRPVIRDVNTAFTETFGYEKDEVLNKSINDIIVPNFLSEEANKFDKRTEEGKVNNAIVERETANGIRKFVYMGIPYGDGEDKRGFAVYLDIHSYKQKESRLMVLHRILRHNLRNSITVISGFADKIESVSDDEEILESIQSINERTEYLSHISRESDRIKRALEKDFENRPVDIAEIVKDIRDEYTELYPKASIEISVDEPVCVKADPAVNMAIKSLVENSIEHNDLADPEVMLKTDCCSKGSNWIELHVIDNAPIIPEQEKETITGDSYTDELRHGSGLGLWLVKWITESCEGVVEFKKKGEERGNDIVLHLRESP
ncbi:PAS domain S-box protein [Halorutilales archaeon Cl-col2-1]